MLLRLICLTWCLVLASGKPVTKYHQEDLLDMVKRALEGGLHQSLDVAKQMISSDLDALESDINKNEFKSTNVMKGQFDRCHFRRRIQNLFFLQASYSGLVCQSTSSSILISSKIQFQRVCLTLLVLRLLNLMATS